MSAWEAPNPDFEQAIRDALATMPAAGHLGFALGRLAPGTAEIIQPLVKELTQQDGYAQAGVLGSLADFAAGAAAATLLPPGWANMTIDYTIKIVAPGKGEEIAARGRVVKPGNVLTAAAADIYAIAGPAKTETLCAVAIATFRNIRVPNPKLPPP